MYQTLRQLVEALEDVRGRIADAESLDELAACSASVEQLIARGHDSVGEWETSLYRVLHDRREALRRAA